VNADTEAAIDEVLMESFFGAFVRGVLEDRCRNSRRH
jgi:hypothetical protein